MTLIPALSVVRRLIAFLTLRHDAQQFIRQRSLQGDGIVEGAIKPSVELLLSRKQHRHGLGVNRAHNIIGLRREKRE
jgi:hypothetical protein